MEYKGPSVQSQQFRYFWMWDVKYKFCCKQLDVIQSDCYIKRLNRKRVKLCYMITMVSNYKKQSIVCMQLFLHVVKGHQRVKHNALFMCDLVKLPHLIKQK
uniref:Uncharacterized protein n=1 Tax=Pyxicephalus adspersus TaxID=30357 RepID=A0AAV3BBZ5_PYXAD|nr:TPA: hypothetical protein GDO54_001875 [Pyxicephalus adspersus]